MKKTCFILAILALSSVTASAQPGFGIRGMGVSAAYVTPEDGEGTLGFGIFADIGLMIPSLSIQPYVDYWKETQDFTDGTAMSAQDLAVGARGLYSIGLPNPVLRPFLGAGVGLHFVKAEADLGTFGGLVPDGLVVDDSDSKLGFDVGGGLGVGLGGLELRGEGWYSFVSDLNHLSLKLGLMFPFGG